MPLESIENIKDILDLAISVFALLALLFFIGLMYKIYQFCVGAIEIFKFFMAYRTSLREIMIQIERFCRRYANIADSEVSDEKEKSVTPR